MIIVAGIVSIPEEEVATASEAAQKTLDDLVRFGRLISDAGANRRNR